MSCFGTCSSGRARKLSPSAMISTFQRGGYPRDRYARPSARRVGVNRPKMSHLPREIDKRTRSQRRADKQEVTAERRAIKKAARRNLKKQLQDELAQES